MTRKKIVAGNWKMHGSAEMARALAHDVAKGATDYVNDIDVIICPPAPYLASAIDAVDDSGVHVGGQNCAAYPETGAFTGEISAEMLRDVGCWHVIVGHSERRALFGETSEMVGTKFRIAHHAGLVPILCVGETLEQREAGEMEAVLSEQLDAVLDDNADALADAIIAYEPVWAIGTGVTASPAQAQAAHAFLRDRVRSKNATIADHLPILYGGSVKPANAEELFGQADVDGGLIGGAALDAYDFLAICAAAAR